MAVLLLSATMQPLNVISERRLVALLSRNRVALITDDDQYAVEAQVAERRLPRDVSIARLVRTVQLPRRILRPNRRNLLLRDGASCQYCGFNGSPADLTIDHVIPLSRGGRGDRWENLVIACRPCNWRKGDRRPEEVGLELRRRPRALAQEFSQVLFLRHPELRAAYEALMVA